MKRFLCAIFGHQYASIREFGYGQRMVGCVRCKSRWGMHDGVRALVPWDGELEQMYKDHGLW